MTLKTEFINQLRTILGEVGGKDLSIKDSAKSEHFITRSTVSDNLVKNGKSFGFISFIRSDQATSGRYSGLSVKVNPGISHYRLSLDIGDDGFGDDYQLTTLPGMRRQFLNFQQDIIKYREQTHADIKTFCSLDFSSDDTKRQLSDLESDYRDDEIDSHPKDLFVAFVKKPKLVNDGEEFDQNEDFWIVFKALAATFALLRQWPNGKESKTAHQFIKTLHQYNQKSEDDLNNIQQLLRQRQYVVLQGAPGTGKTYSMNQIAKNYYQVFTQFHAETTYSDFVGGYRPITVDGQLSYQYFDGPFIKAIRVATEQSQTNVLLMIDEINRANLSNVLGEAFYLFEKQSGRQRSSISFGNPEAPISLNVLPKNLYVMATMNTADRSLAVVDFALRRRFAWYSMTPHSITTTDKDFYESYFEQMHDIFQMYATSEELMLEPGQAYYVTDKHNTKIEMHERLTYELLPLIREYLENGLMLQARDALNQYFVDSINQSLFV